MKELILKEIALVVHPSTYCLMVLGALVLIPQWPYMIVLLYGILIAFFNGMNAREMRDFAYSFSLPVSRAGMVRARIFVMIGIETIMLVIMLICVCLRIPLGINGIDQPLVGMPANLALIGFSLVTFALFNAVFFPLYYRDPSKVGIPFLIACVVAMVFGILFEAIPFLPFTLCGQIAGTGFAYLDVQLVVLGIGIVAFIFGNIIATKRSIATFKTFNA